MLSDKRTYFAAVFVENKKFPSEISRTGNLDFEKKGKTQSEKKKSINNIKMVFIMF